MSRFIMGMIVVAGLLGGCRHVASIEVDSADTLRAARGETVAPAELTLQIAFPDMDSCRDNRGTVYNALKNLMRDVQLKDCEAYGRGATLNLTSEAPWLEKDAEALPSSLFYLIATDMAPLVQVSIGYNPQLWANLKPIIVEADGRVPTVWDIGVALEITNSEEQTRLAQLSGSFIEGQAFIQFQRFLVSPGAPKRVVIGDVKVGHMLQSAAVPVVQILYSEEELATSDEPDV